MIVVAILTVRDEEAFLAFEHRARDIIATHGGVIEREIRIPATPPREVHVVHFPSDAAFAAYRADPALAPLAELRARGISATEILVGEDRAAP